MNMIRRGADVRGRPRAPRRSVFARERERTRSGRKNNTGHGIDTNGLWTDAIAGERESGDSSVVTHWTVDQEVVGSNPNHGGNLISGVRSFSVFTQPIR